MKKTFETIVLPVFGVIGTLITLITFLYPGLTTEKVPVSVLIVIVFLMLTIITVLIKINIEYREHKKAEVNFNNYIIKPIQFVEKENVLLVSKEYDLPLNLLVSVFVKDGLYERLIFYGFIFHKQEKFIQVKIISDETKVDEAMKERAFFDNIIIRPSVYSKLIIENIHGGEI